MRCIKNIVLIVSALTLIEWINCFEEAKVYSHLMRTEAVIRNVTNKLFAILKLKRHNQRLSQYLLVNKYFASLTLQDHHCLNTIARISRVSGANNREIIVFMAAINELLVGDNKEIEKNKIYNEIQIDKRDDSVVDIIKIFLLKLREAKDLHEMNSYVKINENVLNLIKGNINANTTIDGQFDVIPANKDESSEIEYWTPSGRRIYKGDRTKIKHYPFMASIQMFNNFQCGGSIIKSDLIITASSCLQLAWNNRFYRENPAFLSVRVGSSFYSGGGEVIPVLEVYFHPGYNPKNLHNNICIVRLTRRIIFGRRVRRRVRKIDIDKSANSLPLNTPPITILGWGAKGRSNIVRDPWQNILSYAHLDIYPFSDCQDIYSKEYVTRKNFCAGFLSKGGGACNRDVGGPGVDGRTLVGVVSFGSPVCGATDAPTVFTKLGYYATWIEDIMEKEVPYSKKITTTLKPSKESFPQLYRQTPKATTFEIPSISENLTPMPVTEIEEVLRMFDDNLFKEFLSTMFDSKEIAEYQDLYNQVKRNTDSKTITDEQQLNDVDLKKITSPQIELAETDTKMIEYEEYGHKNIKTTTLSDYPDQYTVLNNDINLNTKKVDNNLDDLINNIDLKELLSVESTKFNSEVQVKNFTQSITDALDSHGVRKKNESVLTLLYLSDEQKDDIDGFGKSQEDNKGISIATDSFQDLTRTKGNSLDLFNILSEKELYEILSEVIDDEMRNNKAS